MRFPTVYAALARSAALLAACSAAVACEPARPSRAESAASKAPLRASAEATGPVTVTILYTTDEHGWLLPLVEKGEVRGGAAEILSRWVADEGHCPRSVGATAAGAAGERAGGAACADPGTLLLSGGDHWTGPAISSFYRGEPMAEAMARMGYAASAFGNHEFDFGREQFVRNRAIEGFPYLAANVHVRDPRLANLDIRPFVVLERRGVKIGVVGLAAATTLTEALASRFEGIELSEEEPALDSAIEGAWNAGADAVAVIAHECPDKLEPLLARHPEWRLSFAGGGHCHRVFDKRVGETPLIAPGWRLSGYARIRLRVDRRRPARHRAVEVMPEIVKVSRAEGALQSPPDPVIDQMRSAWKERLDKALGETVGYTASGIPQRSPEMGRWVTEAWRLATGADVAIVNDGALRQSVPQGPITKATIYSVMPFDNRLVVCSITGKDLLENLGNSETMYSGITRTPDGRFALSGAPLDPGKRYTVVTIDFLYFGGAGFAFQAQDPSPRETGLDWRAPVIEWTVRQQTSPTQPLESRIHR